MKQAHIVTSISEPAHVSANISQEMPVPRITLFIGFCPPADEANRCVKRFRRKRLFWQGREQIEYFAMGDRNRSQQLVALISVNAGGAAGSL
ncbi:hypothetical protein [Agrobacterium sp. ICMP 6402]|uniref:hypothetical protein n=1 Tax=Agrobacterium sp. ICMP 6402 TaxID=2292443 RepID=UPI0012956164|nr:hypothetical protein [Agrobacterium sp. ICMP 6402]